MPIAIQNLGIRFPVGYSPWYVYEAKVAIGQTFEYMDMLVPTAGIFSRPALADNQILLNGYCFALEELTTVSPNVEVIQVAVPGSLVPLVAGAEIQPEGLVTMVIGITTFPQKVGPATGTELAEGSALGRYRNQHTTAQDLRVSADNDIIYVLTGVL